VWQRGGKIFQLGTTLKKAFFGKRDGFNHPEGKCRKGKNLKEEAPARWERGAEN